MHIQRKTVGSRRQFIRNTAVLGTLTGVAGLATVIGCSEKPEEEVTPAEDLMREHGVLNRIMLVYDACRNHLVKAEAFDISLLKESAQMLRSFVEDYHEMLEEKHLFPRFVNAGVLVDLVQMLYIQHHAGRSLTDNILKLSEPAVLTDPVQAADLATHLEKFNLMYRMHESREDTVIFPAIRKIVSPHEYGALGEDFEKLEHETLGADGFEAQVEKIAAIEKKLGIYDLAAFTPAV